MIATIEERLEREWQSLLEAEKAGSRPRWQTWRERGGLWVGDWLEPGYASDPPAFDPHPGECLNAPAFPIADFRAPSPESRAPIDVVIPLGRGSTAGDAELRFCLRSLGAHFEDFGKVWVVGHKPAWLRTSERLRHLPMGDPSPIKDANILIKIERACRQPELTERFVFVSDDQLLLRPLAWSQLGPYHFGLLDERSPARAGNEGRWKRRLLATADWLRARGCTTWHADTHVPIPMHKARFLELAEAHREAWHAGDGVTVGTWYVNAVGSEARHPSPPPPAPRPLQERKATVYGPQSIAAVRAGLGGRWFLGFNEAGFSAELRCVLSEIFPEKSPFEDYPAVRMVWSAPTLSIIVPTLGRETLVRTLASIASEELVDGDEVLVVQDGPRDMSVQATVEASGLPARYLATGERASDIGATPRNRGMEEARGNYLVFSDDDDVYRPGAIAAIRRQAACNPGRPLMFRNWVSAWGGRVRWEDKTVRAHNVGTPMFVVPNNPDKLARWPSHRGNDYGFIHETLQRWEPGAVVWCPEILQDYLEPHSTEPRPMIRNLLYHIYPVAANEEWKLNVERLLRYWHVFNGRKLIGIVHDSATVPVDEVQAAFPNARIEWLIARNNAQLGETVTFCEGLKRLRSLNPDEATFYAHAKGVVNSCARWRLKNPGDRERVIPSVRRWRNLMYDYCLNLSDTNLDRIVRRCSAAGCFQRAGDVGKAHAQPGDTPCNWFFAGTFYWFNHMAYFGHHQPVPVRSNRWGAEYHLGSLFPLESAHNFLSYPDRFNGKFYGLTDEEWAEVAPLTD